MGVLNVTPDSFSDGGAYPSLDDAVAAGMRMVTDGADVIDVGGESTRPGSRPVSAAEEIDRVLPVVERLVAAGIKVSIDTQKAVVAKEAAAVGATMVNDVSALRDPEMAGVCADAGVQVVLMHMLGTPEMMQSEPIYSDLVAEVKAYLQQRVEIAIASGIRPNRIWIDPGIGFGKTVEHNLAILRATGEFVSLGYPVLVGASRKRFLGVITGEADPRDRLEATIAVHLEAARQGAQMVRVHDVKGHRRALSALAALYPAETVQPILS